MGQRVNTGHQDWSGPDVKKFLENLKESNIDVPIEQVNNDDSNSED